MIKCKFKFINKKKNYIEENIDGFIVSDIVFYFSCMDLLWIELGVGDLIIFYFLWFYWWRLVRKILYVCLIEFFMYFLNWVEMRKMGDYFVY